MQKGQSPEINAGTSLGILPLNQSNLSEDSTETITTEASLRDRIEFAEGVQDMSPNYTPIINEDPRATTKNPEEINFNDIANMQTSSSSIRSDTRKVELEIDPDKTVERQNSVSDVFASPEPKNKPGEMIEHSIGEEEGNRQASSASNQNNQDPNKSPRGFFASCLSLLAKCCKKGDSSR